MEKENWDDEVMKRQWKLYRVKSKKRLTLRFHDNIALLNLSYYDILFECNEVHGLYMKSKKLFEHHWISYQHIMGTYM